MKLPAFLAIIPFLLAACGGGGGDSATTSTAQSSAPATTVEPVAAQSASTQTASAQSEPTASAEPTSTQTAPSQQTSTPVQQQPSTTTTSSTTTPTTATAQPTISAPAPGAPVMVEYYGDSIIWGWLPNYDWVRVANPEPSVVAADTGLDIHNMGSPGRLAENALDGDAVYPAWSVQMAQSTATHVIIEYHSHDTVADTTARVRKLIQIAKANGKKVIVETIGPGNHSGNLSWEQISQAQRDAAAAENVPVIDQSAYLKTYLANTGKSVWDICADGLHPNPDIYVMKGHYAAKQFAALK